MSLGELLGRCAACCVRAPEEREIGRCRFLEEMARWCEQMRWVRAGLMVRFGLEGGRLIDEDMIEFEKKMLSSDKESCCEEVERGLALARR